MLIEPRYVSVKTLAKLLDQGVSSIYAKVKRGELPPPAVRLSARCVRWNWQAVQDFLRERSERGGG